MIDEAGLVRRLVALVTTEKWRRLYVGCHSRREVIWAIAILDGSGKFWRWWHVNFMQVLEGVMKSMDCSPKGELGGAGSLRSWRYGRCGSLTSRSRRVLLVLAGGLGQELVMEEVVAGEFRCVLTGR